MKKKPVKKMVKKNNLKLNKNELYLARAQSLADNWARKLRVSDWRPEVKLVHAHEFSQSGVVAECRMAPQYKFAQVLVLYPNERPDSQTSEEVLGDVEDDIVHELLHILMPTLEGDAGEAAINILSQMLVAMQNEVPVK